MKQERWQQLEEIYHATLDLEEQERPDFLGIACGSDAGLRREVESLLAEEHQSDLLDRSGFRPRRCDRVID